MPRRARIYHHIRGYWGKQSDRKRHGHRTHSSCGRPNTHHAPPNSHPHRKRGRGDDGEPRRIQNSRFPSPKAAAATSSAPSEHAAPATPTPLPIRQSTQAATEHPHQSLCMCDQRVLPPHRHHLRPPSSSGYSPSSCGSTVCCGGWAGISENCTSVAIANKDHSDEFGAVYLCLPKTALSFGKSFFTTSQTIA